MAGIFGQGNEGEEIKEVAEKQDGPRISLGKKEPETSSYMGTMALFQFKVSGE
jgi:hypothetical protein